MRIRPALALWVLLFGCGMFALAQSDARAEFEKLAQSAASERDAGHAQNAIRDYQQALNIRPDWAEGWWYIGTLEYQANDFARGKISFEHVTALVPTLGAAWNFLGLCEFETKDYEAARSHLEKGRTLGGDDDPEIARVAMYHLALLTIRAQKFDEAAGLLGPSFPQAQAPEQIKTALGIALLHIPLLPTEVDPSHDALVHAAGEAALAMQREDHTRALELLANLVAMYPDTPHLHSAYATELRAANRTKEAQQQERLEQKIAVPDTKPIYALRTSHPPTTATGSDAWARATQAYSTAQYAQAAAELKTLLQSKPQDGTAWAMLGLSEFELKDYDNALLHLEKGHALGYGGTPDSVQLANYRLATLLIHAGQFERANKVLTIRSVAGPLGLDIRFALGMALLRIQRFPQEVQPRLKKLVETAGQTAEFLQASQYDQGFKNFETMLKEHPDQPFLHYAYGTALIAISRYDDAEVQMKEELRISPNSELPYLRLASIEIRQHRAEDALGPAKKASQLAPNSGDAHYLLGRAALEMGQVDEAVKELEIASKLAPNSPEIHFNLAKAYTRAKLPEKAETERATFVRLNALAEEQRGHSQNTSYEGPREGADISESTPH
jgi:tetratricopeptide (TPR) repeat protein